MIAFFLACWLYLAAHATVGTALSDQPVTCTTDTNCGCTDDCLKPKP